MYMFIVISFSDLFFQSCKFSNSIEVKMESWTARTGVGNGSECEPCEDTREETVKQSTVFRAEQLASIQNFKEQKFLLSVDVIPGMFPYEKFRSVQVSKIRFGMNGNVVSHVLAKSLGCLVLKNKDPRERVDIIRNNARMTVSVTGTTMMWIRLNSNQGHNENNGTYTKIVLNVTRSLNPRKFQLVLDRATMEELKMIPAQNKSSREKKQAARQLRKLKQNMTRQQDVLRIKRLHKHDKRRREQQVMATTTFLAASVEQINQGHICPILMDSDSSSDP